MWIFIPADILDKEKFNVELIVQCIRISKMPQTHHHALLLLGAVAGMFPVSNTWNLCLYIIYLFGFQILGRVKNIHICSVGKNFLQRKERQNGQVPCSFRAFYSILVESKTLSWCFGHHNSWLTVECSRNGSSFLTPALPHLPTVVTVIMPCFFFLLLFYIKRENTWPESTCILTSSSLVQHSKV